ncbi:MAG: NADH:ubiquinone reductase (Na(+)-transporting) subunit B [Bacteroidota bacterium]|jgi:Na+-transporting NADH:ubiquinone oxidoreductase subunit B|nr:NADH:ubiquinone reductase (Na(+)-transporting) subunit B [Paludibacteraceae bacterium]MDI9537175.1 NADH:ubiquinone reductase (Na(+)-transporting) subunit B [Bacteroidota bacterium]HHT60573.1 NADH:ubiquinone reductase (Na(+)-transporting) subunit B [Bacteroidales bacterium]HOA45908.1 NADH:ubiquinone reductase (Na(+)-transporting) subunit B [Paludibacteraceae bacterium]HOH70876.1 NADH:ubiquinone reductase (Na(+)-transporting) subunit B [Paludibacteraceae bacterium]
MNFIKKIIDRVKPTFSEGGKLAKLHSLFDAVETFLVVPNETTKNGVHIHDAIDSKRTMFTVIIALIPAMLFGMWNVGYQHFIAIGQEVGFFAEFAFGFLAVLPILLVSYIVGLGIEIVAAQIRKEEVAEGYFVTGFLIPMIVPIDTPLWMVAVATAFAVIFAKEVFGGTGYNIFNVALITRAFLFFAYPTAMSGDAVWVRTRDAFWWGAGEAVDGFSGATPLGQIGVAETSTPAFHDIMGNPIGFWDAFIGWIPGSVGETSTLAILLGAIVLIVTGVASWKIMLSVFGGGAFMALIFNLWGPDTAIAHLPWYEHLVLGGFAFGAVFMATDPVTAARTETGKWIYGFLIGVMAVIIRVLNPGYPEGMMLAILLMNVFGCLIDWFVVQANIKKRLKRVNSK